jgi:hypothetical protein
LKMEKPDFIEDTDTSFFHRFSGTVSHPEPHFRRPGLPRQAYFDIRTWYQEQNGEWKPTKKAYTSVSRNSPISSP